MPLELIAPEAILFAALLDRITAEVPEIRYIEQDMGQLENYSVRPAVSWPCCLIDIDDFDFTDLDGTNHQLGEGFVQLRLGLVKYTDSNNLTPANLRPNALKYMDVAYKLNQALHGWEPPGFSRMLRRKAVTERRDDDLRIKVIRYAISYRDASAAPKRTKVNRPGMVLGTVITS